MTYRLLFSFSLLFAITFAACEPEPYDVVITNGLIYDGTGGEPVSTDIGIRDDRIVKVGTISNRDGANEVLDAEGLAVAPGFINMLSWGAEPLLNDGRSISGIKQGVTLELFGEGWSMGPLNPDMQQERWGDDESDYDWQTLGEFLQHLEGEGISTNVGSFVGATTLRIHEVGRSDREPTDEEMENMKNLVREAMEEGAMGLGSSLIYAPAFYASTDELIELSKAVGEYDGLYISHIRSEGNRFVESVDELLEIGREAGVHAEIHHLKAAGQNNWHKLDEVIDRVEEARADGQPVTANMYNYEAAATSLAAIFPPWTQDGGHSNWIDRLKDPETREQIVEEIKTPTDDWENFYQMAGGGENIILVGFQSEELQQYVGMTLSEIADERGEEDEVQVAVDLTIEDNNRIGSIYYLMSEENVERQVQLPWMSFGSDGGTFAAEGDVLNRQMHPRAWGNFARLFAKYVRDLELITVEDAVHRLTGFPADNLGLTDRGYLREGYFADIVLFDPDTIQDHATFENPHQYATGVDHVFVNGVQVLKAGEHTEKAGGRFIKGPGYHQN